eukprot:s3081_g2.t1
MDGCKKSEHKSEMFDRLRVFVGSEFHRWRRSDAFRLWRAITSMIWPVASLGRSTSALETRAASQGFWDDPVASSVPAGEPPAWQFTGKPFRTQGETLRSREARQGCGITPRIYPAPIGTINEELATSRASMQFATMAIAAQAGHSMRKREPVDETERLRFAQLYRKQNNIEAFVSDVTAPDTLHQIWSSSHGASTLCAGFACQPFSWLGDQKGQMDARATCLKGVLYIAYYLKVCAMILECVKPAAGNSFVPAEINRFLEATGYECSQVELELADVWVSRRPRAWWLITCPSIGRVPMHPWPKLSVVHHVSHVIPRLCRWSEVDEVKLTLTPLEIAAFGADSDSHHKYLLNMKGKAPCALHSWGSQVLPCECGCRDHGLSPHRLASKGLFGLLTQSAPDENGTCHLRQMHPNEVSALNGFDPVIDFGENVRLTLSAVGQIASPLQASWVFGALAHRLDTLRYGKSEFSQTAHLQAYMSWVLMRCRQVWPTEDETIPDDKFSSLVKFWQQVPHYSVHEMVFPGKWPELTGDHLCFAQVLDHLIRRVQALVPTMPTVSDETSVTIEDVEFEDADPTPVPVVFSPCMSWPSSSDHECVVVFHHEMANPVRLAVQEGVTLYDLVQAQSKLVGHLQFVSCCDHLGNELSLSHFLQAGQVVCIRCENSTNEALVVDNTPLGSAVGACDWFEMPFARDVSPTAAWTQPIQTPVSSCPSKFDIGTCFIPAAADVMNQSWISAAPLLALHGDQFLSLQVPSVSDEKHLWSLRHQFLQSADRVLLLEKQGSIWTDDEFRFHLTNLVNCFHDQQAKSSSTIRECTAIDPLLLTGWLHNDGPIEQWGLAHPEVKMAGTHVISVCMSDKHWIPVSMVPMKDVLTITTWDEQRNDHDRLNKLLERIGHALGFTEVRLVRQHRMFFTADCCGAAALSFLHHCLLHVMLPTSNDDLGIVHARFRKTYLETVLTCQLASRPWIWGSGDRLSPAEWLEAGAFRALAESDLNAVGFGVGTGHRCSDHNVRIDLLNEHGKAWGDDEIRFHIADLIQSAENVSRSVESSHPGFVMLEPLILDTWNTVGKTMCETWCRMHPQIRNVGTHIVTAFLLHEHWIPAWIVPHGEYLIVHMPQDHDGHEFQEVFEALATQLGFVEVVLHLFPERIQNHSLCGPAAICFLGHVIADQPLPETIRELEDRHTELRAGYVAALYSHACCICPVAWGFGPSPALVKSLSAELSKRGVPDPVLEQRTHQAIRAIGGDAIQKALSSPNAWRSLKTLGNQVKFQFILPDELSAIVSANKGAPVGKRQKPVNAKPVMPKPVDLDPSKLVLLDGTFRFQGKPVPQLLANQLGPLASGIALLSVDEAGPYLKSGQQVSSEPLALCILHPHGEALPTALPHTPVTVPCKCLLNQEPLLVEMMLVQVGVGQIEKYVAHTAIALDHLDVATIKMMVYKDEFPGEWPDFCSAPIRHLVNIFPLLKRCHTTGCQCDCWHNPDQLPVQDPILDVWRRQHLTANFKPVQATKSDIFSVCIRVPMCLVVPLLQCSGASGVYTEPRTPDGKTVLDQYVVVWTPKLSAREVAHAKQTNPSIIGVARLGERRGVRVPSSQAQRMHEQLRPEATFLPSGPRSQYVAGPFPWGSDRAAICKAMRQIGWQVKALQPLQPVPGKGTMWILQSVDDPPETVITMSHGEVLVSTHKQQQVPKVQPTMPVATANTLSLCGTSKAESDPWTGKDDPWRHYDKRIPVAPSASDGMQQMEQRIESALLAKLQVGACMDQDDSSDRLAALEGQVQALASRQQSLDTKFGDFSAHHTQQMASMQGQLEQQNQSFSCLWLVFGVLPLIPFAALMFVGSAILAVCRSQMFARRRPLALLVFGLFRIGEASNPGPSAHFDEVQFTVGAFNPSGLRNKEHYVNTHVTHGDLWAISETHFFGRDVQKFRAALKRSKSVFPYSVCDSTSLKPSLLSTSSWKGVMMLSKHLTRVLPVPFPDVVCQSGRVLCTTTLLHDAWITGAVVYGEPNGHNYPNYEANNELLLNAAASHVCHLSHGLRFVAGDWNVTEGSLPVCGLLEQAGFQEVQNLAFARWGQAVKPTCKQVTRKDFLYISPELQALLTKVDVIADVWADHAIVQAQFRSPMSLTPNWVWPVPNAFPWPSEFAVGPEWSHHDTPTAAYAALWTEIEHSAELMVPYPVPNNSKGRGRPVRPYQQKGSQFSPVKSARAGDFQPHFLGVSTKHAQWVRQVRRCQTLARLPVHSGNSVQRAELWGVICRARGFLPDFCTWWSQCPFRTANAPVVLPWIPPDCEQALALFESLSLATRDLESQLMKQSRQYARFRRSQNPNVVFQDLKATQVPGVDVLLQPIRAEVTEVDPVEGKIVLGSEVTFEVETPVFVQNKEVQVIHHDSDCLWVEDASFVQVGHQVTQTRQVGLSPDLADAFIQVCKEKWLRHADVPADRWETILRFAQIHLPTLQFDWPSLSPAVFADLVRRKAAKSTGGMDGVSLLDLQRMPSAARQAFCTIFDEAEQTGLWPQQLLDGKVVCLAKHSQPESPLDFRPITIFSLLYRVWSSHHARAALRVLEDCLPDALYGSRPGRYAAQVWSQVLWIIEQAYVSDTEVSGLVADLQKAFNFLPRRVVIELAAQLGIPTRVLLGWSGALTQMARRFSIRGSLSPPLFSCTGFPEGCALSCVAMVIIDFAYHRWLEVYFPLAAPLSFVDDWQLLTCNAALVDGAKTCLDKFLQAVDLQLDARKTYTWSVSSSGRQQLKSQGHFVAVSGKNLGAHVQLSRQHTNATQVTRIASLSPVWNKLRLSASAYPTKVRALRVAAWPKGLHAIAATTISDSLFHSLRTGAMKGLQADGAGCNAFVHLGMVEHTTTDPHFWAICHTFRFVRECGIRKEVEMMLALLAHGELQIPTNSLTNTLLVRIQRLGWHVCPDGLIVDAFGSFSLFRASLAELVGRAQWGWQRYVAQQVLHRPGMVGLEHADVPATQAWLRKLSLSDRLLMHKLLNGTHVTEDCISHCHGGSDVCPYCQSVDSRFHRFWVCEHFAHCRADLPRDVHDLISTVPEFASCYGWSLRPSTLHQWYQCLASIQEPPSPSRFAWEDECHLFTDGSCLNQNWPEARVASWAVVRASREFDEKSQVLDSGPLPGFCQSSYRAEIFAVLRALEAVRGVTGRIFVWTDCSAVVRRLRSILRGALPRPNSAHSDLWMRVYGACQMFCPGQVEVTEVRSHQLEVNIGSYLESWCAQHNAFADSAAKHAQWRRPPSFWPFYKTHLSQLQASRYLSFHIQKVLLSVSREVARQPKPGTADSGDVRPDLCETPEVPVGAWIPLTDLHIPLAAVRWYGDETVRSVLSWFWAATWQSSSPVRWVSHFQLYCDYMMSGEVGPFHLKGWQPGSAISHGDLLSVSFQVRTRWFVKALKESLRHHGHGVTYQFCRPHSRSIHMHTGCLAVPWNEERLELIDEWILQCIPLGVRRVSTSLEALTMAPPHPRFDPVWFTSRKEPVYWHQHDHDRSASGRKELRSYPIAGCSTARLGHTKKPSFLRTQINGDRPAWMRGEDALPGGWCFTPANARFAREVHFTSSFKADFKS